MTPTMYAAPHSTKPLYATVRLPGSKSITNRALILAALADGPSTITGALRSRDTDLMIEALRNLGVDIIDVIPDTTPQHPHNSGPQPRATTLRITPQPLHGGSLYCGLAGTLLRFLPGVAALAAGDSYFDADDQAHSRPLSTILLALRDLGATIDGDHLPFTIHGRGELPGGQVTIDASGSSQFVSGLLLCAARTTHGVTIRHEGDTAVPSQPHVDMTIDMLAAHGVHVDTTVPNQWHVAPTRIAPHNWAIEPDLSNATPFLAAAAITGGRVTIPDWPARTTQPGDAIRAILSSMGCTVELTHEGLTVTGPTQLRGITLDMGDIGELTPTVAALACCATTPSTLSGIAHLRGHETNRLRALVTEINLLGGAAHENPDGLTITPAPLHGGEWHTYADHRMATTGTIIGLAVPGVTVHDIHTTGKTLPGFAEAWTHLIGSDTGADTHPVEVWL